MAREVEQILAWAEPNVPTLSTDSRYRDSVAEAVDAQVVLWYQYTQSYIFPLLKLHPLLLCRIDMEGISVSSIAMLWPRQMWYFNLIRLLTDVQRAFQIV